MSGPTASTQPAGFVESGTGAAPAARTRLTIFAGARIPAALLLTVTLAATAWAGTTGSLKGTVVGDKHEPLMGVNVRIEGQRLGAVTDANGSYLIVGIRGGVHIVRANLMGYAPFVAENVSIAPDFATELNITLETEAVQLGEVRVEAQRPLLQKDATGTTRFISAEDIQNLPTRGYRDAAAQQSGVVNFMQNIDNEAQNQNTLIVRGGRPNEVAYYVDGFSQQDPLTGTSSTAISNNAIQEVVLLTGGFAPEYGRVMSGAVNVITREGQGRYFGALEAVSDALSGGWVGAPVTDYNIYDLSLGGPVVRGRQDLTFYFSGSRRWQRDRAPSFLPEVFKQELASRGLDDNLTPGNSSGSYTAQGKLSWQLNDRMSIKAGGLGSEETWSQYTHSYLNDLAHTPRYLDRNQSYFGTFNHVLSPRSFYNLGVNFFQTLRKRGDGQAFDDLSPHYVYDGKDAGGTDVIESANGVLASAGGYYRGSNPRYDSNVPLFYDPGHVFDDYLQRNSAYTGLQASFTTQPGAEHHLKFGGDFQYHTLRYFNHFFPVQLGGDRPNLLDFDAYGYDLGVTYKDVVVRDVTNGDTTFSRKRVVDQIHLLENGNGERDGPKHPKTFSLYAQDKFEREGVIVNGGLRFDYINVDTPALKSDRLPLGDPDDVTNIPDSLEAADLTHNRTYARVSPRLGVAFPLDDRTLLRFNFGQFYQQPNLQDLYVSYEFLQHKVKTGGYFVGFGNPNLRPERTTAYEVGMARQMGENLRLDVTAYYKDVKDLVEISTVSSFPYSFSSYRNRDFATIKGIDVGFTMRPVNHISGNVAYSLSFANGTGSVSQTQRNIAWTAGNAPKQTAPLDFDQRHKIALNVDWRLGKGEGPSWGRFKPLENTGANLLFNVASGTPYTPTQVYNEITLANVASQPSGSINSRYGPWTSNLDFKATRGFGLGGLQLSAYVWVLNLFDTRNPISVYNSSGSAQTTTWLNSGNGQTFLQTAAQSGIDGEAVYRLGENNPTFYTNPRLVRFGLRTEF